ncbi:MAG: RNA methyltransferase [Eubacteriales bacterium]|nr:RNA methyltransferase [Eubacteriales bacterium]
MSIRIESRENPLVKRLVRLSGDRKYRKMMGEMVCEGGKMLGEALSSGIEIHDVLVADNAQVDTGDLSRAEQSGAKLYACPSSLLAKVSNVQAPQGVVFSCERPVTGLDSLRGARRLMVLEGLQDPGNLGTVIRTADAFALDGIILCEGCVDPTSPKVVRATMGAAFRLPIAAATMEEAAAFLQQQKLPLYGAALAEDSIPLTQIDLHRAAVLIGNEGRGITKKAAALCDQLLIIPMEGRAESLNASVAASIIMYEMSREGNQP